MIKKAAFDEIKESPQKSFFKTNNLPLPTKEEPSFASLKKELKEWAQIDLDSLMYHLCSLPEKTLDSLQGRLPEILQLVEKEAAE